MRSNYFLYRQHVQDLEGELLSTIESVTDFLCLSFEGKHEHCDDCFFTQTWTDVDWFVSQTGFRMIISTAVKLTDICLSSMATTSRNMRVPEALIGFKARSSAVQDPSYCSCALLVMQHCLPLQHSRSQEYAFFCVAIEKHRMSRFLSCC